MRLRDWPPGVFVRLLLPSSLQNTPSLDGLGRDHIGIHHLSNLFCVDIRLCTM